MFHARNADSGASLIIVVPDIRPRPTCCPPHKVMFQSRALTLIVPDSVSEMFRLLHRLLTCGGGNHDFTSIRRPSDGLSKVIKVTVTQHGPLTRWLQSRWSIYCAPAPSGDIKRWCAACLTLVCLSRTSDLSREQRGLRIKLAQW